MGKVMVDIEQLLQAIRRAGDAMVQQVLAEVGLDGEARVCPVCKTRFLPKRETQRQCSRRCRVAAHRKRKRILKAAVALQHGETPKPS